MIYLFLYDNGIHVYGYTMLKFKDRKKYPEVHVVESVLGVTLMGSTDG